MLEKYMYMTCYSNKKISQLWYILVGQRPSSGWCINDKSRTENAKRGEENNRRGGATKGNGAQSEQDHLEEQRALVPGACNLVHFGVMQWEWSTAGKARIP